MENSSSLNIQRKALSQKSTNSPLKVNSTNSGSSAISSSRTYSQKSASLPSMKSNGTISSSKTSKTTQISSTISKPHHSTTSTKSSTQPKIYYTKSVSLRIQHLHSSKNNATINNLKTNHKKTKKLQKLLTQTLNWTQYTFDEHDTQPFVSKKEIPRTPPKTSSQVQHSALQRRSSVDEKLEVGEDNIPFAKVISAKEESVDKEEERSVDKLREEEEKKVTLELSEEVEEAVEEEKGGVDRSESEVKYEVKNSEEEETMTRSDEHEDSTMVSVEKSEAVDEEEGEQQVVLDAPMDDKTEEIKSEEKVEESEALGDDDVEVHEEKKQTEDKKKKTKKKHRKSKSKSHTPVSTPASERIKKKKGDVKKNKNKKEEEKKQDPSERFRVLIQGGALTKYGRKGKPHKRFVWIDPSLDKILWKVPNKNKRVRSILIKDVTDVAKGCATKVFQRYKKVVASKEHLCLNITTTKRTLDLEMDSSEQRDLWFSLLNALLCTK